MHLSSASPRKGGGREIPGWYGDLKNCAFQSSCISPPVGGFFSGKVPRLDKSVSQTTACTRISTAALIYFFLYLPCGAYSRAALSYGRTIRKVMGEGEISGCTNFFFSGAGETLSPVPELYFLPNPYRGWTRERRVQDNLHAHAQNDAIFAPQIEGKTIFESTFQIWLLARFSEWQHTSNNLYIPGQID